MIFELPFMPEHEETDSKSSVFESWPYSTGSQSRQANRVVMLPARNLLESASARPSPSTSIPLPSSHVHRTSSELQLYQDQEVADQRDTTMFYRLVNGIRERHQGVQVEQLSQSERSLRSIIHTRLSGSQDDPPTDPISHQFHFHQPGMAFGVNHISPIAEAHPHGADEWSLTGFNEHSLAPGQPTLYHTQPSPDEADHDAPMDTDSEIFDLDP